MKQNQHQEVDQNSESQNSLHRNQTSHTRDMDTYTYNRLTTNSTASINRAEEHGHTGSSNHDITSKCVGNHGNGEQNSKGRWLRRRAAQEELVITDTFFKKTRTQTSHILLTTAGQAARRHPLQAPLLWQCVYTEAGNHIDMNSDHRAIVTRLRLPQQVWNRLRGHATVTTPTLSA